MSGLEMSLRRLANRCNNSKLQGGPFMKVQTILALLLPISMLAAQNANDTPEAHVAIAKTAAGEDYQNLFNFVCATPAQRGGRGGGRTARGQGGQAPAAGAPRGQGGGGQRGATPDRSTWHAEPVKAF